MTYRSFFTAAASLVWILSLASAAKADPVRFAPEALGQNGRITLSPGFSPDGQTVYFAQSECTPIWKCPQRLKVSQRIDGEWTMPERVALPRGIGPEEPRVDYPSVSPDGQTLLFSWSGQLPEEAGEDVTENFDLYRLDLTRDDAVPERLKGPDMNRLRGGAIGRLRFVNNETAPSLTDDGDLYFWTERLDGPGERDVYIARSDGQGGFQRPEPLPSPINSSGRDDGAWVHPSGRLMLITYGDRGGQGGPDLFVSTRGESGWSDPVNLGPEINGAAADFAGVIAPNGRDLYFTSNRAYAGGDPELYQIWTAPVSDSPALVRAMVEAGLETP